MVGYFHLVAESPARNAAFRYGYTQSISFLDRLFSLSPRRREFGEQQLMFLRPVPYGRLLDFGCGNGAFIRRMTALGWQCDGVEFDERAVAFARELNPHVTIHKGGPETLDDFPENTYDAITLYGVIEHLHHPKSIVEKAFRLLKKGGRIVILMPNTEGIGHRFFNANWRGLEPPRHLNLFNQKNARMLFDGIPFENVKISSSSELAIYIWSMSREIQRGKFHFTLLPRLKFRIEAWLVYYGIWFLDFFRNQPIEKDSIKIEAVK